MNTRKKITFLFLLMVLALILVAAPSMISHSIDWSDLSKSIGYAIFILAGLQILEATLGHFFSAKPFPLRDSFGLQDISPSRNELEPHIAAKMRSADKIKILSTCLAGFHTSYAESIQINLRKRRGRKDVSPFRMILMNPKSDGLFHGAVISRNQRFERDSDASFLLWTTTIQTITDLGRQSEGLLTVRLNPYYPLDSVFIIDDDLYLTPYIYGLRGTIAPCYHFTKRGESSLYAIYEESFDRFWEHLSTP